MEKFDKRMALSEIEDALANTGTPYGRGMAIGLCGAFYMCGLLNADEWEAFMGRIPVESHNTEPAGSRKINDSDAKIHSPTLN